MLRDELYREEILEIARKILHEGPICNHCLGRQFAKISSGVSNEIRGEIVRELLTGAVQDGKCWLCNGLFAELDRWVEAALKKLSRYEYDSFLVGTKLSGLLMANEELMWELTGAIFAEPLKAELNREVGKRIERATGKRVDLESRISLSY